MQIPNCHFQGQAPHGRRPTHTRRPERWNGGWARGMTCQPRARCTTEQEGLCNAARDMNHSQCHSHPVHHHHSKQMHKHHYGQFMKRFHHFPHNHNHFHSHHHGHHHHHGHSHHHGHCNHGGMSSQSCKCMPEFSCTICPNGHQNKNCETGPSSDEAQKNTRSVGTETEEVELSA